MLTTIRRFFRKYRQFGFVVTSFVIAIVLDLTGYETATHWLLGTSAVIHVGILVWRMFEDVRDGRYGIDILAVTAIITSVILREYWAGIVIVLTLTGQKVLEDYAKRRARGTSTNLPAHKSRKAILLRGKKNVVVTVSQLVIGDQVLVMPGELIPADGWLVDGLSSFDQSNLTGESMPVIKQVGEMVMSGSINMESAVVVKVAHAAADSQYEQINKLARSATATHAPFVRLADRFSIPFTIVAFVIAGAAWIVSGDPHRFLEVLVVATPCSLILGAPIALMSGIGRAAKHGIIIKTGSALERLSEIATIAFEKTGVLTRGIPVVSGVVAYNGFSKQDVLAYAASLERNSNHAIAGAIVDAAEKENIKINLAKQVKEKVGYGLSGRLQGKTVLVGRLLFMTEANTSMPASVTKKEVAQTTTYVAINDKLAGIITFVDELRPEAHDTLRMLKKAGIKHTMLVTGDNASTANAIAKELGINTVFADCRVGDKIQALEAANNQPVGFVGDGVQDAPVLTAADVGVALGVLGSTAASESADVVIMLDDITKVASSVAIAKRTFSIARQTIVLGVFVSLALMAVFSTGEFRAVHGAVIQALVVMLVILNALRAHSSGRKL